MNEQKENINPYNFNNKLITLDMVQQILNKYDIIEEPTNLDLYQQAFIHKSYSIKKLQPIIDDVGIVDKPEGAFDLMDCDSERLEFLGDSVIGLIVAKYLFERFNDQNEGFLTKIKTKLVRGHALGYFAKELNFGEYLIISRHIEDKCNGRNSVSMLEDCFEAFVGAMILDFDSKTIPNYDFYSGIGFQLCEKFIINLIESKVDFSELIITDHNYKEQLSKYFQKEYKNSPKYKQISAEGIGSDRIFVMGVYDNEDLQISEGVGSSKKVAQQNAAKNALIKYGVIEEN